MVASIHSVQPLIALRFGQFQSPTLASNTSNTVSTNLTQAEKDQKLRELASDIANLQGQLPSAYDRLARAQGMMERFIAYQYVASIEMHLHKKIVELQFWQNAPVEGFTSSTRMQRTVIDEPKNKEPGLLGFLKEALGKVVKELTTIGSLGFNLLKHIGKLVAPFLLKAVTMAPILALA